MRHPRGLSFAFVAGLAAVVASGAAHALSVCVGTATELRDALDAAEANGENDTINLRVGNYDPPDTATAFGYTTAEDFSLTIAGGFGPNCTSQFPVPTSTVLDGSTQRRVLNFRGGTGTGAITVRNLTIQGGATNTSGAGAMIGASGFRGNVTFDSVVFRDNDAAQSAGGLYIITAGLINVRNSLFHDNVASVNHAAALLLNDGGTGVSTRFNNNTLVYNGCEPGAPASCDTGGVRVVGSHASVYNNAFAFNAGADVSNGGTLALHANNVRQVIGPIATQGGNVAIADPKFVDVLASPPNLRLTENSPLRNAGTEASPLPAEDIVGADRRYGRVDIGAYELQTWQFEDDFETY